MWRFEVATLRISDEVHRKLTAALGALMAETGKMQTYDDALDALLSKSVILPEQLLIEIEEFINENKDLGYVTKEDFLRDAARQKLQDLKDKAQTRESHGGKTVCHLPNRKED
jgi:hypothetical protein